MKLEVSIYRGAAFLLAYNNREATRDIDAILRPKQEGEKLAAEVAKDFDLPEDWLNSKVQQFISPKKEAKRRSTRSTRTTLSVHRPTLLQSIIDNG